MTLNTSRGEQVAARRRRVASLRLEGLSQREILARLEEDGVNCSLGTVNADLKALREDWRAQALQDVGVHTAMLLAEIREVRRRAWSDSDLDTVLKALKQERDLLGLDAPKRLDVRHELARRAERLARRYGLETHDVVSEAEAVIREMQK